VQPKNT
jgi:hypothetical protein